jgi:hypothetical protein
VIGGISSREPIYITDERVTSQNPLWLGRRGGYVNGYLGSPTFRIFKCESIVGVFINLPLG